MVKMYRRMEDLEIDIWRNQKELTWRPRAWRCLGRFRLDRGDSQVGEQGLMALRSGVVMAGAESRIKIITLQGTEGSRDYSNGSECMFVFLHNWSVSKSNIPFRRIHVCDERIRRESGAYVMLRAKFAYDVRHVARVYHARVYYLWTPL
jgi:hypothetical protein